MKTSFVQVFDSQADAMKALGYITGAYPKHHHTLVTSSNQIQIWAKYGGKTDTNTYGTPDASIVYMVVSAAPD